MARSTLQPHQESSSPVSSVSRPKGVVDVNVAQFGQGRPEGVDLVLTGLGLQDNSKTPK